nr:P3 [Oat sterile dwarf virus]
MTQPDKIKRCLQYFMSSEQSNTHDNNNKINEWYNQMIQAGYDTKTLTSISELLSFDSKVKQYSEYFSSLKHSTLQLLLTNSALSINQVIPDLYECSSVNKKLFDIKQIQIQNYDLNFSHFSKYVILTGKQNCICYDDGKFQIMLTKAYNKVTLMNTDNQQAKVIDIVHPLPELINDYEIEFDVLLHISEIQGNLIFRLINAYMANDSEVVYQIETFKSPWNGSVHYFSMPLQHIYYTKDSGSANIEPLSRFILTRAVLILNFNLIKREHIKFQTSSGLNLNSVDKNYLSKMHQLAMVALSNTKYLLTHTSLPKLKKIELHNTVDLGIGLPELNVKHNLIEGKMFDFEFTTDYLLYNIGNTFPNLIITPYVIPSVVTQVKSDLFLTPLPDSTLFLPSYNYQSHSFVIECITDKNTKNNLLCELVIEAVFKTKTATQFAIKTHHSGLKKPYLYGVSYMRNIESGDNLQTWLKSVVGEYSGTLGQFVDFKIDVVARFKIYTPDILYSRDQKIEGSVGYLLNNNSFHQDLEFTLCEDQTDGIKRNVLLSQQFTLVNDAIIEAFFPVSESRMSDTKAIFNSHFWPGPRAVAPCDDYYHAKPQTHHVIKPGFVKHEYPDYMNSTNEYDILYEMANNYHYLEAPGNFSDKKLSDWYFQMPILRHPDLPSLSLNNTSLDANDVVMTYEYEEYIGTNHPCLIPHFAHTTKGKAVGLERKPTLYAPLIPTPEILDVLNLPDKISVTHLYLKEFTSFCLPEGFNNTLHLSGGLLQFENELGLTIKSNVMLYGQITQLEIRLKNLFDMFNSYFEKLDKKHSITVDIIEFIGEAFIFGGELALVEMPMLGIGLIVLGIIFEGTSKILKDDFFSGVGEIIVGLVMLYLGKRKFRHKFIEEFHLNRRPVAPNLYVSTMSNYMGRRRSSSSYHTYESIDDIYDTISLGDRRKSASTSFSGLIFQNMLTSTVDIKINSLKSIKNENLTNRSDQVLSRMREETDKNKQEIKTVLITFHDYIPFQYQTRLGSFEYIIKLGFTILIDRKRVKVKASDFSMSYLNLSNGTVFQPADDVFITRFISDLNLTQFHGVNDFKNYYYTCSLLSHTSATTNMLIESNEKLIDRLFTLSTNNSDYLDKVDTKNIYGDIFNLMKHQSVGFDSSNKNITTILSRAEKFPGD